MTRLKIRLLPGLALMVFGLGWGIIAPVIGPHLGYWGFEDGNRVEFRGQVHRPFHHYCGMNPSIGFGPGETFNPKAPYGTYGNCRPHGSTLTAN